VRGLVPGRGGGIDDDRVLARGGREHDGGEARGFVLQDELPGGVRRVGVEGRLRGESRRFGMCASLAKDLEALGGGRALV
jgi:hypothetical protein